MIMFAMIITTVVLMSVVIQATQTAITPDPKSSAGFEIRTSFGLLSFFDRVTDMAGELARTPGFPLEDVAGIGAITGQSVDVRQVEPAGSPSAWQFLDLTGMDTGFMAQAETVYTFQQRAAGFEDDLAVWRALAERDDVVIVTPSLVANADGTYGIFGQFEENFEEPSDSRGGRDRWNFRLTGFTQADALPEVWLDLRGELRRMAPCHPAGAGDRRALGQHHRAGEQRACE